MRLKFGKLFKMIFGGTVFTAIVAVIAIYNFAEQKWNDYNAEIEATLDTQHINTNDSRTIVVCISNESEEIDWTEVQIVPSFYNPTEYKVEKLSVSYDVKSTNISFEPTDFYVMHKYSKNRNIYKFKEQELNNTDFIPSPFYSYTIEGDYAECDIITKELHKGLSKPFTYETHVYVLVIKNDNNLSFTSWLNECHNKMAKMVPGYYCDAYFIDNNHHIKHEHAFALKFDTGKEQKGTSIPTESFDKDDSKNMKSSAPLSEKEYKIKSFYYLDSSRKDYPYRLFVQVEKPRINKDTEECLFYYRNITYFYKVVRFEKGNNEFFLDFKREFDLSFMKVLRPCNINDYLFIKSKGEYNEIKNVSDNKIIYKFKTPDGNVIYGELSGNQVKRGKGEVIAVFDTGIRKKYSDYNISTFSPNLTLFIIFTLSGLILNMTLAINIDLFLDDKKSLFGSSRLAFKKMKRRFSFSVLKSNLIEEKSWFIRIVYIIGFIFNIMTLLFVIPFDIWFLIQMLEEFT